MPTRMTCYEWLLFSCHNLEVTHQFKNINIQIAIMYIKTQKNDLLISQSETFPYKFVKAICICVIYACMCMFYTKNIHSQKNVHLKFLCICFNIIFINFFHISFVSAYVWYFCACAFLIVGSENRHNNKKKQKHI